MVLDSTAPASPDRDGTLTGCLLGFVVALWLATTLSIVKPGPRTRWGKRVLPARRRRAPVRSGAGAVESESTIEPADGGDGIVNATGAPGLAGHPS